MTTEQVGPVVVTLPDICPKQVLTYLRGLDALVPAAACGAGAAEVAFHDGAVAFAGRLARIEGFSPADVGIAALHPDVPKVRVLQDSNTLAVVVDWQGRALIELVPGSDRIDVWLAPELRSFPQLVCFVVGSLMVAAYGLQAFHGSVVEWKGRAVLLAGASGSGKTSFSLALAAQGARWLTEDTTHTAPGGLEFVPVLMRDHISVRPGTYAAFRDILEPHPALAARIDRTSAADLFAMGRTGQARVTIPQSLIGQAPGETAPLAAVVFPTIDSGATGTSVRPLASEHATMVLDSLLMRPIGLLFALPLADDTGLPRQYPRARWSSALPAYSVRVGLDYRDHVADLCDRLVLG